MSHDQDGLGIARERIAEETRARTGSLDLGMLGLEELPVELFALTHLRCLNLGVGTHDERTKRMTGRRTKRLRRKGLRASRRIGLLRNSIVWPDSQISRRCPFPARG